MIEHLRVLRRYLDKYQLFWNDRKRFLTYYSKDKSSELEHIKAKMIFYSHSLEKGLSRECIRLGFGEKVVNNLLRYMQKYGVLGFNKNDKCYLNSVSVMRKYLELHNDHRYNLKYISPSYNELIKEIKKSNSEIGGVLEFNLEDRIDREKVDFKYLALNRYSIRDYDSTDIDLELINEAIFIATKSPSVCNRQSVRVYVISEKKKIEETLKIQGGFKGYPTPPCLILITSDIRDFIDISERNQPYIDGGIFSMSLLYALEYQGFATCVLNAMFNYKKSQSVRKLLDIPQSENLILFLSVGNFKNNYTVPKSFRYPIQEITKYR